MVFDAVGTVIHPEPAAALVYADIGARFGSRRAVAEIAVRFAAAFREQEERDRAAGWRTSEARERERWRQIVGHVLDDATDSEACFAALFEHFSQPNAWRCNSDAAVTLERLSAQTYTLGLASNYDRRLRRILTGLPQLRPIHHLLISSEIGWRKPAPHFFAILCQTVGQPPDRVLYVGDDLVNDYEGAKGAGLKALLLDPRAKFQGRATTIARLTDLLTSLPPQAPAP